jgi:hypothetical protein
MIPQRVQCECPVFGLYFHSVFILQTRQNRTLRGGIDISLQFPFQFFYPLTK